MLLERFGKACFSQIKPVFFYAILLTPVICALSFLFVQSAKMEGFEERFYTACKKGKSAIEKKERKELFTKRYSGADPYFLDTQIESLVFLQEEQNELKNLLLHPALENKKPIESRLQFLSPKANCLTFTEEAIRSSASMKETEEKQRHPVQMNEMDVKKLLSLMEDLPIESFDLCGDLLHRPQMIITDFRLEKKQTPLKTNVFEVEMQFIKREFIQ